MSKEATMVKKGFFRSWLFRVLVLLILVAGGVGLALSMQGPDVVRSEPLEARLELAAGAVHVEQDGAKRLVFSGEALLDGAKLSTGEGARALVRLSNGAAVFLRDQTAVLLKRDGLELVQGELWLDAPPTERDSTPQKIGDVTVFAADTGASLRRDKAGSTVYVARGEATVTAPGGRVEVKAGERAVVKEGQAPEIEAVAFWEDWTGGMADNRVAGGLAGAGAGQIFGVDRHDRSGAPARMLEISRQSVRAVIRDGMAETEVDQTFFNPTDRSLEGWYWFAVPEGASVTGFALETNGVLVEGEFIEKRRASAEYERAAATGHEPALLEWIDSTTFRARIFPVPAAGSRRAVLRYVQLLTESEGILRYVYPMQGDSPVRIGEFSLAVDLGEQGRRMGITTLADARIEDGGRLVTMRRSGYTPRADFMLEARLADEPEPLRVYRMPAGQDAADYLMLRYTPDFDFQQAGELKGEVVVVVDTSAAGDDTSRGMQVAAAEAILRAMSKSDRFALMSLDVRPKVLYPEEGLTEASEEEISRALEKLAEHGGGGATDLASFFDVALARLHGAEQPALVYVGDGIATSGEMRTEQLVERLRRALSTSRARLFSVGVGPHARRGLLGMLARAGGGEAFFIERAEEITERALTLVAALKTPTLTELTLDLGAGLDEVFSNVSGKVSSGEQVIVLARSHHDLPGDITVRGRLGGKSVEREYDVSQSRSVVAAFVPRLWAAEYLRRLMGSSEDPELLRGKIMQLGVTYGLMTPYTSILALESEQAFRQQGIQRRHRPLRGVRLSALQEEDEDRLALALGIISLPMGLGCNKYAEEAPALAQNESAAHYQHQNLKSFGGSVGGPPPAPGNGVRAKAARPSSSPAVMREESEGRRDGVEMKRMAARRAEPADEMISSDDVKGGGRMAPRQAEFAKFKDMRELAQVCSDASRRSLRERVILWRKRLRTATSANELIARHQAARQACELQDWSSEATFLRVMQPFIRDEGSAVHVLRYFGAQPDVQHYLARLILRRAVDKNLIAAVESVLFAGRVNWAQVDIQLSELSDLAARIARLRQIMALAPNDPNGILRLMHLLAEAGQVDEALVQGRRLRDAGLATPFLARELGDLLARQKLSDEALRTYSEIVEFDPASGHSRRLLGDIYLAHGWYDAAYRQFKSLVAKAPDDALGYLRLAASAAGAGRVDEALRLERQVARNPGRPGPDDPRRFAKLWSAARLSRMLAEPPETPGQVEKLRDSLQSKLKELQLFRGQGTLVVLTWEDLSARLRLSSALDGEQVASGESTDASITGLSAAMLPRSDSEGLELQARLRSLPRKTPLTIKRQDLSWDGKRFTVKVTDHVLPAGASHVNL